MADKIVLGTRGSKLALAQARLVESALREKWSGLTIETRSIKTHGDEAATGRTASLSEQSAATAIGIPTDQQGIRSGHFAGRKGLFTAEIEGALLARDVDIAVHSAKDLPSELTPETEIAAVLPRAPVDDVLVSVGQYNLQTLPLDGIVATGSVRRQHQLHWKRPDLDIVELRGNVPTRLRKLTNNVWHGIILARAGLERLGLQTDRSKFAFEGVELSASVLSREVFLPAGGQGVVAIQIRSGDDRVRMLLEPINNLDTESCLRAEREFLRLLQADCNQPVGVHAQVQGATMIIRAQIFDSLATTPREATVKGSSDNALELAAELWDRIHAQ
jgi:hydroxymethylbilane synthase